MERQKVTDAPIFMSKSDFFAPKSDFGPPGGSQGGRFFLDSGKLFLTFSNLVAPKRHRGPSYKLALCNVQHPGRFP